MQNLCPIPFERERPSDVMDDDGSAIRLALINVQFLKNKSFILNEFVRSRDLDFVFITWLNTSNTYVLGEAVPNNFTVFSSPLQIGRGGRLASVFKDNFICTLLKFDTFSSF